MNSETEIYSTLGFSKGKKRMTTASGIFILCYFLLFLGGVQPDALAVEEDEEEEEEDEEEEEEPVFT